MAGDQEHDPLAAGDRPLERAVDRAPRAIEVHPVKVEHAVGLDRAGAKPDPSRRRAWRDANPPRNGGGGSPKD